MRERRATGEPRSWRPAKRRLALGAAVLGYHSSGLPGPEGQPRDVHVAHRPPPRGRAVVRGAPGASRGRASAALKRWRARWSREGDHRVHPPPGGGHHGGAAAAWRAGGESRRDAAAGRGGDAQARPVGRAGDRGQRAGQGRRRAVPGARRRRHDPVARCSAMPAPGCRCSRSTSARSGFWRRSSPRTRQRHPPSPERGLRAAAAAGDRAGYAGGASAGAVAACVDGDQRRGHPPQGGRARGGAGLRA